MNTIKPFHAPQILLDQFQRPVAPIPGATMLEVFSLQIYCTRINKSNDDEALLIDIANLSILEAKILLSALHKEQSENQISELKIIDNE